MTKTKKIAAAVLSLALVGSIAIGGTLAYLTDKEEATNVFKIGDVDITLEEDNFEENNASAPVDIEPGVFMAKDPNVTNVGTNAAYIRVAVTIPQASIGDPASTQDLFILGKGTVNGDTFVEGYNDAAFTIGTDSVKWLLKNDGYYYLVKADGSDYALPAGAETAPVFTQVQLNSNIREGQLDVVSGAEYSIQNIGVVAQAVQTGSFATADAA